jgi:hypothetical protein
VDAAKNPFNPGAGSRPPELAGRDAVLDHARIAIQRIPQRTFDAPLPPPRRLSTTASSAFVWSA